MPEIKLTTLDRLEKSAAHLADLREQAELEEIRRNELIVQAYEESTSVRAIARAAAFRAHSRVMAVVALSANS